MNVVNTGETHEISFLPANIFLKRIKAAESSSRPLYNAPEAGVLAAALLSRRPCEDLRRPREDLTMMCNDEKTKPAA
ncbi:MAG: hypothetical protein LBV26_00430 [Bacteroidales bacterium]|jgi:hypothetical protein|nr:hypothetical protein [Bacteroidales bacterium]